MAVLSQYKQYWHFCSRMTKKLISVLMLRVLGGLLFIASKTTAPDSKIVRYDLAFLEKEKIFQYHFIQ